MGRHSAKAQSFLTTVAKYAKFVVAFVGAVGATAAQVAIDGVPADWNDWMTIAIYFLTALGVRQVPNKESKNVV